MGHSHLTGPIYRDSAHLDDITRMQMIDLKLWLPGDILPVADKMSMAHSLELRVPFLIKMYLRLRAKSPLPTGSPAETTKHVLREALRGVVPDHVLTRPKLGFPVPLRNWLHGVWGDRIIETIESSAGREWFDMDYVRGLLRLHRNGRGDHARKLWTVYMFCLWHDAYIKA